MTAIKRAVGVPLTDEERIRAQHMFLEQFAKRGNLTVSAAKVGVSRQTIYQWQEHDEQFSLRFNQAKEDYCDVLRAEIHRRAVEGTVKPVFQQGVQVGQIREYSDTLLIFQAKAKMPEYRDRADRDAGQFPEKAYVGFAPEDV